MVNVFRGRYYFLSNFYPCRIIIQGKIWMSSESLYQASKTLNLNKREEIRLNPDKVKQIGKYVILRDNFNLIKLGLMKKILNEKFKQNQELMAKLNKIEGKIVEGNTWHDNFWGECSCNKCKKVNKNNNLGKLLMEIRDFKRF